MGTPEDLTGICEVPSIRHLLAAAAHHLREQPPRNTQPARHDRRARPRRRRLLRPLQRPAHDLQKRLDRRRRRAQRSTSTRSPHGEPRLLRRAGSPQQNRPDRDHLGSVDGVRPRRRRQRLLRRRHPQRGHAHAERRRHHQRHRRIRLGRRHLKRRRHADRDALARGQQPQHQSRRRRRLGRDPELRPQPGDRNRREAVVNDSTIAGNSAALGGGIFSWCGGEEGACSSNGTGNTTTVTNSTIANNDGGARSSEGGGLLDSQGTISVENSIVADNTVEDPLTEEFVPSNCGDTGISSLGHNLQSGADCAFAGTGDLKNTEPGFLSDGLQDNGGNTDTLALEATSPAVDAIPSGAPGCSGTDQRDIARPQGTGCDIGAYELFQPIEGQQFSEVVGTASPREGTTPTIEWGDGTAPSSGKLEPDTGQLTGTHTYVNEGIYHASFTYTNSDGFPESRPFDVKVQDAPLIATGVPVSATAGVAVKAKVATFTHTNPAGAASDYTATITWGDGTASTAGTVSAAGRRRLRSDGLAHLRRRRHVHDQRHDQRHGRRQSDRHRAARTSWGRPSSRT